MIHFQKSDLQNRGQILPSPKFQHLYLTQNLMQIMIFSSNMPQFNHMTKFWIFVSYQSSVVPPKLWLYLEAIQAFGTIGFFWRNASVIQSVSRKRSLEPDRIWFEKFFSLDVKYWCSYFENQIVKEALPSSREMCRICADRGLFNVLDAVEAGFDKMSMPERWLLLDQ